MPVLVCLTSCGLLRRNGARLREMADSRVLATARHIHICLRVAVLRDSSHFRRFRPAGGGEASRAWHPREFGAVLGGSASLPLPAPPLPSSSRRYAPQCFVGGYTSSPCDVSHRASDEPRRCMSLSSALAPSSLASPSIRRVFLRSICARRCPIGSLNLVRGESSAWLILVWHVRYTMPQNRCYCGKWQKATKCKKRNAKGVSPHLIEL